MSHTLFRLMLTDDAAPERPRLGRRADCLGVRIPPRAVTDVEPDENSQLTPGDPPRGMSVQIDDPRGAPPHRLPPELDGNGEGTLFELDDEALPELLVLVNDHDQHGVLAPRRGCTLRAYEDALGATQTLWRATDVRRFSPLR